VISNRVREGEVIIARRRYIPVFDQSEVEVSVKTFLQLGDVLHPDNSSDTDLFTLLLVSERSRHTAEQNGC
jgi:hypothetical protein